MRERGREGERESTVYKINIDGIDFQSWPFIFFTFPEKTS